MSTLRTILDAKGSAIHSVAPGATVLEATDRMCRANIGALLVLDGDLVVGIVSERDLLTRVMLERRDPATTTVGSVMSTALALIGIHEEVDEAMSMMTSRRCRHLPVMEDGHVVGIVSMGDLVHFSLEVKEHEIRSLREYVSGIYVGVSVV